MAGQRRGDRWTEGPTANTGARCYVVWFLAALLRPRIEVLLPHVPLSRCVVFTNRGFDGEELLVRPVFMYLLLSLVNLQCVFHVRPVVMLVFTCLAMLEFKNKMCLKGSNPWPCVIPHTSFLARDELCSSWWSLWPCLCLLNRLVALGWQSIFFSYAHLLTNNTIHTVYSTLLQRFRVYFSAAYYTCTQEYNS